MTARRAVRRCEVCPRESTVVVHFRTRNAQTMTLGGSEYLEVCARCSSTFRHASRVLPGVYILAVLGVA